MIDYTAMVDREDSGPGEPVQYFLNDLNPANDGAARTYTFAAPETLNYPVNQNPLLSKAIALEIRRKIEAMKIELG